MTEHIDKTRSNVKAFATALNKVTDEVLIAYYRDFLSFCRDKKLVEFEDEIASITPESSLDWTGRDAKTNALPKGTEMEWFRLLFPSIPQERDKYRNDPFYRALQQTFHPKAEKLFGIKKSRKPKLPKSTKEPDVVDENNVAMPTSIKDIDYLLQHSIVQAMLETIASFVASDDHQQSRLLDYARSHQVSSGYLTVLEAKQKEYIARQKAIIAAKKEKAA